MTDPVTPKLANRYVCFSDGADIACNAPSLFVSTGGLVGINTTNPQTQLEVNGTVSASAFVGNGAGLTGVTASSGDRIVSGTNNATSMVAVSSSGYISVTQSGTNTAYFHPQLGLVSVGVSTTGGISGTTGYFNNIGIGASPSPFNVLVSGTMGVFKDGVQGTGIVDEYFNGALTGLFQSDANAWYGIGYVGLGTNSYALWQEYIKTRSTDGTTHAIVASNDELGRFNFKGDDGSQLLDGARMVAAVDGTPGVNDMPGRFEFLTTPDGGANPLVRMVIKNSGNIGIGTTAPSTTLTISGSQLNTSWTAINMNRTAVVPLEVSGTISATTLSGTFVYGNQASFTALSVGGANVLTGTESDPQIGTLDANEFCQVNAGATAVDCGNTAAQQRTALGLGTLSTQDANAVAITGGNISVTAVSATGNISANKFVGDGSLLTNLAPDWYAISRVPTAVQAVSSSGSVQLTDISASGYVSTSFVSATLVDATRNGTVSATYGYFGTISGSGAGLTNIPASAITGLSISPDRISTSGVASGATLGMVVADQGTVSFTTGGVAGTAYLDTTGRWIGPGVSITTANGISSTNGYFTGNVGIGTSTPATKLVISGGATNSESLFSLRESNGSGVIQVGESLNIDLDDDNNSSSGLLRVRTNNGATDVLTVTEAAAVGIGTTDLSATLTVSGSQLNTSWTAINMNRTAVVPLEVSGTISATALVLNGQAISGGADNLGNHTATRDLLMGSYGISGTGNISASAYYSNDANAYFYNNGSIPSLVLDSNDYLRFTRSTNTLDWLIGGSAKLTVDSSGNVGVLGNSSPQAALDATGGIVSATTHYGSNGSVSVPAYSFSNDTNLGIYRAGADVLGVTVGAANVASFSAAGLGAIGVTVGGDVTASGVVSASGFVIGAGSPGATGAIRYNATSDTLQVYTGSGWKSLTSGTTGADWYAVTNIPAQVQAVSNSGSLQLTNVTASGYVSAATISGTYVSATLVDATRNGIVSATYGYFANISGSVPTSMLTGAITATTAPWTGITGKPVSIVSLSSLGDAAANSFVMGNGTDWTAVNAASARTGLGLGTMAVQNATSVAITGGTLVS